MMYFVYDQPALIIKDYLVIADLHLGRENKTIGYGDELSSLNSYFLDELKKLKNENKVNNLIILGDVKEDVFKLTEPIFNFFYELNNIFNKVIIVKGNHDVNIENLKSAEVVNEYYIDDIALVHGHSKPSKKALQQKYLLQAHLHFHYPIENKLGKRYNKKIFFIADVDSKEINKQYGDIKYNFNLKTVFLPSFNPLIYGLNVLSFVRRRIQRYRLFKMNCGYIYTTQGICLGDIKHLSVRIDKHGRKKKNTKRKKRKRT